MIRNYPFIHPLFSAVCGQWNRLGCEQRRWGDGEETTVPGFTSWGGVAGTRWVGRHSEQSLDSPVGAKWLALL